MGAVERGKGRRGAGVLHVVTANGQHAHAVRPEPHPLARPSRPLCVVRAAGLQAAWQVGLKADGALETADTSGSGDAAVSE